MGVSKTLFSLTRHAALPHAAALHCTFSSGRYNLVLPFELRRLGG